MKRFAIGYALLGIAVLTTCGCSVPDKEAALELIHAAGGSVSSDDQGRIVSVDLSDTPATDEVLAAISLLPHVRTINCSNAPNITGSGLGLLGSLRNLETLYLVGTSLDDAGLLRARDLTGLKTLSLNGTEITDQGMPAIDNLENLQTLDLGNTAITDRGLVQLRDLRNLSTVVLRNTKTTNRGVKELDRMLHGARIVQ